ncbi:hypothetical protein D0B54_12465 [Solimonas sp. K1W22B-7]|uniref:hypothetical protein n=1 Tax=Solimonas sp. K1W22B-7 TaxID=2303331 RepID=UPI000E331FFD|nr:hypothetical protein [Solimonas sp. K1W22B-7]AXQ29451.1 hypothetical protein D0B54_12465 [Solimonas sp. K1W22B-7]
MKFTKSLSALALMLSFSAQAQTAGTATRYIGSDGNWFNPANWSTGQVPAAGSDVTLDGRAEVVIDPALGRSTVEIRDLTVGGDARLTGLPGVILSSRNELLQDNGAIVLRSGGSIGETLVVAPFSDPEGCSSCSLVQNPTSQSIRTVVLRSSVTVDLGLGGTSPAGITKVGPGTLVLSAGAGYYSTTTADILVLDGQLRLSLHYGFQPRHGQSFQIYTARQTRTGQFLGLPEGGLVGCTDDNVGFTISYKGGDGNDVVLSAADTAPQTCLLLPAVQKVREAAARMRPAATQTLGGLLGEPAGLLLPAVQKVREAASRAR